MSPQDFISVGLALLVAFLLVCLGSWLLGVVYRREKRRGGP